VKHPIRFCVVDSEERTVHTDEIGFRGLRVDYVLGGCQIDGDVIEGRERTPSSSLEERD